MIVPRRLLSFIDRGKIQSLNLPYLVLKEANKDMCFWNTILHIVEHLKMLLTKGTRMIISIFGFNIHVFKRNE
jgi:hypothetical protein